MASLTYQKQACAVFGCRRWSRQYPAGWSFLCRDHWKMVPAKLRKLHGRLLRRAKRYDTPDLWKREAMIWRRCVKAATEETLMGMPL